MGKLPELFDDHTQEPASPGPPGRERLGALSFWATAVLVTCAAQGAWAQSPMPVPRITFGLEAARGPRDVATSLQILFVLTILSLAPALIIMTTSFVRTVIVLSFVRNALGTQQMPPNMVLVGLALLLTFFVMAPSWKAMNQSALQPYLKGQIGYKAAMARGVQPVREFMFKQTRPKDLSLFLQLAGAERPRSREEVATYVLAPSFVISELKTAFQMGFMLYIPFLIIDMVVASALMSMGMLMLPPVTISLPFKILLFVMVDGWHLIVRSLLVSFH